MLKTNQSFPGRMDTQLPRMTLPHYLAWLGLALLIVLIDQLTKAAAVANLELYRPVALTPWLNLTLAHNTGAAFSLLADADGWQRGLFIAAASAISIFILIWLWRLPMVARTLPTALMLVLGGAIGNLIDRFRHGYVIDFIDFHYQGWHWPAFNFADTAIVVGVGLMLIESLFEPHHGPGQESTTRPAKRKH